VRGIRASGLDRVRDVGGKQTCMWTCKDREGERNGSMRVFCV